MSDADQINPAELRVAMRRLNVALNRAIIAQMNMVTLQLEPLARNLEAFMDALDGQPIADEADDTA